MFFDCIFNIYFFENIFQVFVLYVEQNLNKILDMLFCFFFDLLVRIIVFKKKMIVKVEKVKKVILLIGFCVGYIIY